MSTSAPIRIDIDLLSSASAEGSRQRRTPPKQIEYWADLGRSVDGLLSASDVIALRAGLMRLEPVPSNPVNPDELFATVEADRPALARDLRRTGVIYQVSEQRPGYLEAVHPDGRIAIGLFRNGVFESTIA